MKRKTSQPRPRTVSLPVFYEISGTWQTQAPGSKAAGKWSQTLWRNYRESRIQQFAAGR